MVKHQHIGKLLPIEGYYVKLRKNISVNYQQSLTHLYQPLIGVQAVSLYQTLLNEFQMRKEQQEPQTHHSLMSFLSLSLDKIYEARLKLEGIGLLNTYQSAGVETNVYTYRLNAPFSPREFFEDGMLSQLLYHHLGEKKYKEIMEIFIGHEVEETADTDITAGFNEVFDTRLNHFAADEVHLLPETRTTPTEPGPHIPENTLDFVWMEQMLRQRMLPPLQILTAVNKKLMTQMTVLYDLTTQELENALIWAINEDNMLDRTEFKSACHDLFQSKKQNTDIKLVEKSNGSDETETVSEKPKSKEEQFVQMLESISPKQLLEDLSGGYEASSQDLKVVSDVMTQQGLSPGVMNVLVHYVLLKTDMKLSKAYLEKIAGHWARKNVQTAKQAMVLAKSENQKYLNWGNNKPAYTKTSKKEVVPDWFKERQEQQGNKEQKEQQKQHSEGTSSEPGKQEDEQEIAALLKKYSKTQ